MSIVTDDSDLDPEPVGRRERKKRATRLALKAATLDLVAERGFAHVTVEDIADAVDVSVRTFFNYFASKEAAVIGEDPEMVAALAAQLTALPPDLSPLDAMRTVMFARLRAIEDDIDLSGEGHTIWMRRFALVRTQPDVLVAYTKHLTVIEQALTDALLRRLGDDERLRIYASMITTTALAAMRIAGTSAEVQRGAATLTEVATRTFDFLASGLSMEGTGWPDPHDGRDVKDREEMHDDTHDEGALA